MAVAAPARRAAPAPGPSRTAPPPKRTAPARRAPARRSPPKATPKSRIAAGGQLIPIAVGRTAVAVRQLPDSGLVVRMTRGRAWIAVLGLLLVGIVALNVATLSFAASSGKLDGQITALENENTMLESRAAERYGASRVRAEAAQLGLVMPTAEEPLLLRAHRGDAAVAAQRLAAAGG